MNTVDILDNAVRINGHFLRFPVSYGELEAELGEARVCFNERFRDTDYVYDELGIIFNGSPAYLNNLKKKKAYIDNEHMIISLTLYVTGRQVYGFKDTKPEKQYEGTLTFSGQNIIQEKMWRSPGGYGYQPNIVNGEGKEVLNHVSASLYSDDDQPIYDGDRITKDVNITFKPERPKSSENFNIVIPDEECLVFDTYNFKLAVINELMYNQLVLKPYFDIYDYMAFKKAHWNLETDKNIRAAVKYFKELPVPARFADLVAKIEMDGSDEIYMQIAPEWDGRDDRFDFHKLTEREMSQFRNLKKMTVFGNSRDTAGLKKMCEPLGIEVEPLTVTAE
ncbi:MAG: hypothetical protein IKG15_11755 [Solobacterium sp.]|nr:hypothetical protein [Solobacterium sp.]